MKHEIVKKLAFISNVKLFFDQQWQVALYGQPAQSEDGWIINVPADEVFVGEFSSLPVEALLAADWVQDRVAMRQPLPQLLGSPDAGYSWNARAPKLKKRMYEYADLFRDLALECEHAGSLHLAVRFMRKAQELRPSGPVIQAKMKQYLAALQEGALS